MSTSEHLPTETATTWPQGPLPREHAPGAVVSLVFGVLGLTLLPVLGSILALAFGYQSRRAAKAEPQHYNDSLGQAGRVLGWVGLALVLLFGITLTWLFFAFFPFHLFS